MLCINIHFRLSCHFILLRAVHSFGVLRVVYLFLYMLLFVIHGSPYAAVH